MEDPRWLRLITIGLILAALAVGYLLISGKIGSTGSKTRAPQNQTGAAVNASASPASSVLGQSTLVSPSPSSSSAYDRIINRNQTAQGQTTQTLPRTGFPAGLAAVLSISAIISGWGLRKFPH